MLAIFKTGGKQYSVKAGQILKVEKLEGNKGDNVSFSDVLAIADKSSNTIGNPLVKGATVKAIILEQIRDKKIIVFKKRRRQNYRSTQGHRQYLTVLQIENIAFGDKNSSVDSKAKIKLDKTDKIDDQSKSTLTKKKVATKKTSAVKKTTTVKKTSVKKKSITKKATK